MQIRVLNKLSHAIFPRFRVQVFFVFVLFLLCEVTLRAKTFNDSYRRFLFWTESESVSEHATLHITSRFFSNDDSC